MAASRERQIREAVMHYIAGGISLRQFQEWFAPHTWNIDSRAGADDDLRRLANDVDLLLAEFSNGHWTEEELRSKLQQYRRVVQPVQAVGSVEVQALYVHVMTNGTHGGYGETMYPGAAPPIPSPRIEASPLPA
jgi:hypothetical protein